MPPRARRLVGLSAAEVAALKLTLNDPAKRLKGDMSQQLDRQLLSAWINFANGGVEYSEMLDTDGNRTLDTSFINVMKQAELIRRNPASTKQQLQKQRDILTRINQRDGL